MKIIKKIKKLFRREKHRDLSYVEYMILKEAKKEGFTHIHRNCYERVYFYKDDDYEGEFIILPHSYFGFIGTIDDEPIKIDDLLKRVEVIL